MSKQQEILSKLKKELIQRSITPIIDIILYGSQINGKANPDSDYDILIVSEKKIDWQERKAIGDICAEIAIENEVLIDYKIISNQEINQNLFGRHPLIQDAVKFGLHA